jgi:hypothetical protein
MAQCKPRELLPVHKLRDDVGQLLCIGREVAALDPALSTFENFEVPEEWLPFGHGDIRHCVKLGIPFCGENLLASTTGLDVALTLMEESVGPSTS